MYVMCFKEINESNFSDYLYSIKYAHTLQKMLSVTHNAQYLRLYSMRERERERERESS